MKTYRSSTGIAPLILSLCPFTHPAKNPGTQWLGGWVGPEPVAVFSRKETSLVSSGIRTPVPTAITIYRLSLPPLSSGQLNKSPLFTHSPSSVVYMWRTVHPYLYASLHWLTVWIFRLIHSRVCGKTLHSGTVFGHLAVSRLSTV